MLATQEKRIWDTPLYADFPRSEYEDRVGRVRKLMEEEKLDVLVFWDPANIRYFSGFHSLHYDSLTISPAVFVLPLEKDPVIAVPDFFAGVAHAYTYLDDIRIQPKPHVTRNIRQIPVDIAEIVKELGCGRGRVGLETGGWGGMAALRSLSDMDRFRAELSDATLVDACDLIWKCRTIKSAAEVEAIKVATRAIIGAYGEVVSLYELGMSEREVGRMLRTAILERTENCMPPIATCSSRPIPMPDTPSFYDDVTVSAGDRIVFEPLPTYKGYGGSCCRCFHIGPMPDEARKKDEGVDYAQAAAIAAIKPGVKAKQLLEVIEEALQEKGMGSTIEMAGHGVGLNMQEPPMIAEEEEDTFQEGMVLAIEVWVVDWAGAGLGGSLVPEVYGNEDLVLVTKDGCDRFPSFRRDIRSLPHEGGL
jgi:Xaa-Pro aminopeptidase